MGTSGEQVMNNGSLKTIGGVAGVIVALVSMTLAVIGGARSITEPIGQRLNVVDSQISEIRGSMAKDDDREMADVKGLGAIRVQFEEVETQFDWLKETTDIRLNHLEKDRDALTRWQSNHGNDAMWERVRALERRVYGKPLPKNGGEVE